MSATYTMYLHDSEKLVYLQSDLKGGRAKSVVEGLLRPGEFYYKPLKSLRSRYDRPRLATPSNSYMLR